MEKYQYEKNNMELIENSRIPFAIYQLINKRVVTIALSAGFCDLFGFSDKQNAYFVMNNDMYRDAHPDDVSRIADAAFTFATEGGFYNIIYRSKKYRSENFDSSSNSNSDDYMIIHARGEHVFTVTGERLAIVWYTDEGIYSTQNGKYETKIHELFNNMLHNETLFHRNYYDFLTGLPNMSHFFDLAEVGVKYMLKNSIQPAMLFVDFTGMKSFNRKYGFSEGDQLIRALAKILVSHFSNENCGRFGQDHFAIYTQAINIEKTLQLIFNEARSINNGKTLPVRVGIYLFDMNKNPENIEIATACDRAKMACDVNRKAYISVFEYFNREMLIDAANRTYILENFDKALKENWIQVYYQPIVRTVNGKVCDEEALARWFDPVRGMLSPLEFVPILEDSLLIYKLDLHILEQALQDMKTKINSGVDVVPVSINLSRSDFDSCDMVQEICNRVDSSGIGRDFVNIEITESVIGQNYEYMKIQIDRVHQLGFKVWMDDFGSGYSSLDVLQSFDFELIKFDMHFMRQFSKSEKSQIILAELMKMALRLGIDTVVEGVENEEQMRFLKSVGCDKVQGFLYSKPIPLSEILRRYKTGTGIGFENTLESEYYTAIGTANLNDPSAANNVASEKLRLYFNSIPMAVIELNNEDIKLMRCNNYYAEFMKRYFNIDISGMNLYGMELPKYKLGELFINALKRCKNDKDWIMINENLENNNNNSVHSFLRKISENPVTGAVAIAVLVLSMI